MIAIVSLFVLLAGCRTTPQSTGRIVQSGPAISPPGQYTVPAGELLCVLEYPDHATVKQARRFNESMKKLTQILDENKVPYMVRGYLSNLFYIKADYERAKQAIQSGMAGEPFPVSFHPGPLTENR